MESKEQVIDRFEGKWKFLSNFYVSPVIIASFGFDYLDPTAQNENAIIKHTLSVEHAYQAEKALHLEDFDNILALRYPGQAKRAGNEIDIRSDWERIKIEVMRNKLRQKFNQPVFSAALLYTGDAVLIEGNHWGDKFWGVCDGKGNNVLGNLLMEIREELQSRYQ